MRFKLFVPLAIILFVMISCKKNDNIAIKNDESKTAYQYQIEFATVLSKALADIYVRTFLKEEALKKFGNDYDIFYPLIKDKKLSNGYTFSDYLDKVCKENKMNITLTGIENKIPLLNILVPNFKDFSAEGWDIEQQIPIVGIRNKRDIKKNIKMKAIKASGETILLDYFTEPDIPLIIIKENESLIVESKFDKALSIDKSMDHIKSKYHPIFETPNFRYFFADESLYKRQEQNITTSTNLESSGRMNPAGCSRAIFWENYHYTVQEAFDKNIYNPLCPENTGTTRDYVYYGIDPTTGVNQGPLNYGIRECITSIRCEDINTRSRFDDIAEGDILDFDIVVYTADSDPVFPLKKRLSVNKNYFFITNSTNPTPIPWEMTVYPYSPLEFAVWNFKRQGDIWKFAIFEYDPGSTITESRTISANLGINFTIGDEKVGGKFGVTASYTSTKTVTITYTDVTDDLGEALSYWCDPVIKQKFIVPSGTTSICGLSMGRPLRTNRLAGRSYDIGTGAIAITVEPQPGR